MTRREGSLPGDEARARLYEVMRSGRPVEERLEAALEIGVEYFGVDYGYVTEIDGETDEWEVIVSTGGGESDIAEGLTADLSTTYCRRTIREEGVIALHDVPNQGWEDDVAFDTYGLQCYHGAPIIVGDEPYGTVCFSAEDARAEPFTEEEKGFTHLIAGMAGHEIERARQGAALDEREAELEERREVYRAVIDASFDLVFRIDGDGRFTYNSRSVEDLLGYTPEELDGEPFAAVLPDEETVEMGWELFEQVLAGETVEEPYLPLETAGGDRIYADIRATPIYRTGTPAGERSARDVVAVQGTARDATDRKRREQLIRVLNRVLRHNLRNDMNIIAGLAGELRGGLTGEDAAAAGRIVDTAERLTELGETARELERNVQSVPEPEPVDVVPLVREAAARVDEEYPDASVAVEAPGSAVARAAPRLGTAVSELLDNAAKHAGERPSIEVSVAEGAGNVVVRVADDGPGLPEQERSVLTSGEETPLVHGSGLGLWLVYWIVTSLDGDLEVRAPGGGADIAIRFPRAPEADGRG